MLKPKDRKFRKEQRGRMKGKAKNALTLDFGDYGIKALEPSWITGRQLEAARVVIARHLQNEGRMWMRVFPDKPVTKTPAETRMGKGKGEIEKYVAPTKPGRIIFEITGIDEDAAEEALTLAGHKLPIRTKFIKREIL
jgi:large subunit ribosomal protein L16